MTVVCERSTELACTLQDLAPETDYELYCYVVAGGHTFRSETISFTTLEKGEEPEPTPDGKVVFRHAGPSRAHRHLRADAAVTYTCEGEATVTDAGFLLKKTGQSDETRQSCGTAATSLCYTTGLSENTSYEVAAYVVTPSKTQQHGRRVHHRGRRRHAARQQYPPQRLGGTAERSVERRLPLRRP